MKELNEEKRKKIRQQYKNESFNRIIKMYKKGGIDYWGDEGVTYEHWRDTLIGMEIDNLLDTLKNI